MQTDQPKTIDQCAPGVQELYALARDARERSYSPYSTFKVGAAIRLEDGHLFTGCNVENVSFGGSVCAERVAVLKAVSELGTIRLDEVMVVTDAQTPWPPCGMCLQVMTEFGPEATVYLANLRGDVRPFRLSELMPQRVPLTGWR